MAEERLQKILAAAGIASRRKAEELIVAGRVSVNGKTVVELGSKADLAVDEVKVDGQRLSAPTHFVYFALNKPKNCVTTVFDPEGRETVMKFFKGVRERIYPVGRLDYASEGLLLLTNDGDFAAKLMSPASHVSKTYLVKIKGLLTPDQEEQFRTGIPMHGRRTAPAGLRILKKTQNPWYEVRLIEGRQNQIRVMFKHFGHLVEKLKRIRIGFLDLGALKAGVYRTLTASEVEKFKKMLDTPPEARPETFPKPEKRSGFTERATGYNEKKWAAERKATLGGGQSVPERKKEDGPVEPAAHGADTPVRRVQSSEQRPEAGRGGQRRLEPRGSSPAGEKPSKFPPKPFYSKPFSKPENKPGSGKPSGGKPSGRERGGEQQGASFRGPAPRSFSSKPFSARPFAKSSPSGKPGGKPDGEGQDRFSAEPPRTQFPPRPFSPKPFSRSGASGKPASGGRVGRGQNRSPQGPGPRGPKPFSKPGPDRKPRGDRGRGPSRGGGR
jgi:23S rRNA pseudouridine2605 synthase